MKKWKLPVFLFLGFLIITIGLTLLPKDDLLSKLPLVQNFYTNSKINITSTKGRANIKINGKDYGETNQEIGDLKAGFYQVELNRIADEPNFYDPQVFPVDLAEGTEAIINVEIGPGNVLHGYVIYYSEASTDKGKGLLSVTSDENIEIYLDKEYFGNTPIKTEELEESSYVIRAESGGYESLQVPVVNVYEGYNLNLKVFLMPIPIANL